MFYGIIVLCMSGMDLSIENCTLYNSPVVYSTLDECVDGVNEFFYSENVLAMIASGLKPEYVNCIDLLSAEGDDSI